VDLKSEHGGGNGASGAPGWDESRKGGGGGAVTPRPLLGRSPPTGRTGKGGPEGRRTEHRRAHAEKLRLAGPHLGYSVAYYIACYNANIKKRLLHL